jgi:hypothetical protein
MSSLIIGYGVQGKKRLKFLQSKNNAIIIDPLIKNAQYKDIFSVKKISYKNLNACSI